MKEFRKDGSNLFIRTSWGVEWREDDEMRKGYMMRNNTKTERRNSTRGNCGVSKIRTDCVGWENMWRLCNGGE